jgi:hypothetical protein
LVKASQEGNFKDRVDKLTRSFQQHGPTHNNIWIYQKIYNTFIELAGSHASKVARRKFGYEQSPELIQKGALLLLHKHILDCKYCHSPLTPSIKCRAALPGTDLETTLSKPSTQIRKEVTKLQQEPWETQKTCKENRIEWLNKIAQDRA